MRALLLIAVPLLLAALLWSLLGGEVTPDLPVHEPSPADAPAGAQARGSALEETAPSRTSSESPELPPVPADAVRVTITVVEHGTGQPVASADVAWSDSLTVHRLGSLPHGEAVALANDPEAMARRLGFSARTDESGTVRVHLGSGLTTVFARKGKGYGSVAIQEQAPSPPQGHRIELRDDASLLVQVLDSRGAPVAGVPVWVAKQGVFEGTTVHWLTRGWLPRTDANGMTHLLHLQEYAWHESPDQPGSLRGWCVRTRIPTYHDPGIHFDPAAPPSERVVLRLPPMGSVEARVTLHGKPVAANWMSLNKAGLQGKEYQDTMWQLLPDREGRFLFPCLPLQVTWSILAGPRGGSMLQKEFAGPTAEHGHLLVDIPVPDDHVVITGRCLVAGQPLAGTTLKVEFRGTMGGSTTDVPTGADGRFQWFAGSTYSRPANLERAVFRLSRPGELTLQAVLQQRPLAAGLNEVGDLMLGEGPIIVTGRFVTDGPPGRWPKPGVEQLKVGAAREKQDAWSLVQGLTISDFADGRFEVHGDTAPVLHRLTFFYNEHLPLLPVEFPPGARDLEIRLSRAWALSATLLLPASVPKGIEAELRQGGQSLPADPFDRRFLAEPTAAGGERHELKWQRLPPGSYALALVVRGVKEPLVLIEGVKVPPEGDGRLQDIDLRELVDVLTVRVPVVGKVDPMRNHTMVFLQPQAPADTWHGFEYGKDELRLPVPKRPVDLLVVRTGQLPKLVQGVRGEVAIAFDAWPELPIVVPALAALPQGVVAMASLEPGRTVAGRFDLRTTMGDRSSLFRAPGTQVALQEGRAGLPIGEGVYRLNLHLTMLGKHTLPLKGVSPAEVVRGSAPLEITVSADSVRQALAVLQK